MAVVYNGSHGEEPDERQAGLLAEYKQYFETIEPSLPRDLLRIADRWNGTVYLNDGHVKSIDMDIAERLVTIAIDGNTANPQTQKLEWGLVKLHYGGVSSFQITELENYRGAGVGDHLFDEVELLGERTFRHSMYFHGGREISVIFGTFSLSFNPGSGEASLK